MDWTALSVSLQLGFGTVAVLLPVGVWIGRALAIRDFRGKLLVEALLTVPLVLPPTVLGFYLLVTFGARSPLGQAVQALIGHPLPFSFAGLLVASAIANIPFVVQPVQRGFEAIPREVRDAAPTAGNVFRLRNDAQLVPMVTPQGGGLVLTQPFSRRPS